MSTPDKGQPGIEYSVPVTSICLECGGAELDDLTLAAASSTDFWSNPEDDEDWNDA
jgi:hypothetical protein